jgi:flagellar basal-body rod modification protein FlgD
MTTPLGGASAAVPVSGSSSPAPGGNEMGKDAFLKLLVAQLKYQDPMNPQDGSQFMAQTAQFTMVEKLTELTTQNTELLSASRLLGASTLVGRSVSYTDSGGIERVGSVSGARLDPSGPVLTVDGEQVPLGWVKEVRRTVAG